MKTFDEIVKMNKDLIKKFKKIEQRPWGAEVCTVELTKQVGTLSKHIMVYERYYQKGIEKHPRYKTDVSNIADQLADIFFCLVRIAEIYNIDLEKSIVDMTQVNCKKLKN